MLFYFLTISALFFLSKTKKQKILYKCGGDISNLIDQVEVEPKPINYSNPLYKRRLKDIDEEGFKNFNLYVDLTNLKKDIELYKLQNYSDLFINSINKARETLIDLLKVKSMEIDFNLEDYDFEYLEIDHWDKEKFGTDAKNKGINLFYLGIDLVIFATITEMWEERTLASASVRYLSSETGQPIVGVIYINKNIDFSLRNAQEYFQSIILHEFTHVLGFSFNHFYVYNSMILEKDDKYYVNSKKVIQVAKKYFKCSDIYGVQLEDYGSYETVGSHWDARILLGEYMNGIVYPEEQVISEFTLAALEDLGYYKANYYTGGLMRYGKNKGCKFLNELCVNSSYQINPFFENEFFDSIHSDYEIDNSYTSGRQSRTYNTFWVRNNSYYYNNPNYFNNETIIGWPPADYCPVPEGYSEEMEINYYVGHCSNKGSGEYGTFIQTKDSKYNISEQIKLITGETYSDHSFCYLSSLINKVKNLNYNYSNSVRAVCFETFCSSKSLTVKINNDYIVCPREGGKIQLDEYDGYFLCPDYKLICSGTVLCNNMFDCVDKKSEIKEDSYLYDYEIKTSQNIDRTEEEISNNSTNYELSNDGKCPQYCSHCLENKICIKCKDGYFRTKKEDYILCLSEEEINSGYYLNDSLYYECIENCQTCSNKSTCEKCYFGFIYNNNECTGKIKNCQKYSDFETCKKCKNNFAFKNNEKNCTNIEELSEYYSKDNGVSYNLCDGEGIEHIQNCKKCSYRENKLECKECKNGFIILDDESNKCYSKNIVNDTNKKIYYINGTHARTCSKEIKNCILCENDKNCVKCEKEFYLLNDFKSRCYDKSEINPIEEYYLSEDNTTYYSCKNIKYNSFSNCRNCTGNNTCSLCNTGFYFVEGDKNKCTNIYSLEENKYYVDPNFPSTLRKCTDIIHCEKCFLYGDCFECSENAGIFELDGCLQLKDYYNDNQEKTIFLLGVELYYSYIYFYMFLDFIMPYDFYFKVPIKIKYSNYSYMYGYYRGLQEINNR